MKSYYLLSQNINLSDGKKQQTAKNAFVHVISEYAKLPEVSLNKAINSAVYILCWFNRYKANFREMPCIIYLNGCKNKTEVLFMRFLAEIGIDTVILLPDKDPKCAELNKGIYTVEYEEIFSLNKFPTENFDLRSGTVAYHAERELDGLLYEDTGIYRNMQHQKAQSLILKTMYEEISILWDQEVKFRPNFAVKENVVDVPVIFSKISGVKDGNRQNYWKGIKKLINENTVFFANTSIADYSRDNPIKPFATSFFPNRKLNKRQIKSCKAYQYGFLREEMQDYILDKLEELISSKIINGTFENGAEYMIISVILYLNKDILRKLQNFDFTKENPKFIAVKTDEIPFTREDASVIAFLSLAGFDVLIFAPTGYRIIENHFNKNIIEEHNIGEFLYDMVVPDMNKISAAETIGEKWHNFIFGKGR